MRELAMLWRVVVLALMPLVPLPGFAHAHAEYTPHDPSGSDRPPHFHLRPFYDWALGDQRPVDPGSEDHDDDAIYVSASVVLQRGSEQCQFNAVDSSALLMPPGVVVPLLGVVAPSLSANDPPCCAHGPCPIYLRICALLI